VRISVQRTLPLLTGVALLASGCDARTPTASRHPPTQRNAAATASRTADIVRLLQTDSRTLHDDWVLFNAQQRAVAACMRRHGFSYAVNSGGDEPAPGIATAETRATTSPASYGVAADASAFLPAARSRTGNAAVTAQDAYVRSLTPQDAAAYAMALDGPVNTMAPIILPSGRRLSYETRGCLAEARAEIFGSVRDALLDALLPGDVQNSFFATLGRDDGYRHAVDLWRGCMRRAGHPAKTPAAVIGALKQLLAGGTPPAVIAAREQAAAAADMSCDARSRLRALQRRLLVAYSRRLPAAVRDALAAVADRRRTALAAVNS